MTTGLRMWGKLLACVLSFTSTADLVDVRAAAPLLARAAAADEWQARFETACSRTQDAMSLSTEELRALIALCDDLKPTIAALDESRRKVYSKRLQLCRDLYEFVLQTREKG